MGILKNLTEGIDPIREGGYKRSELALISSSTMTGKSIYYDNLCQEIMITGQQTMTTMLTSLNIPGYPKTTSSLKRLMPEYKFSRANWYVAEFDWVNYSEVLAWCSQQFGPHPARPDAWSRWVNKYSEKIHFRDEKDYQWFLLRWGV